MADNLELLRDPEAHRVSTPVVSARMLGAADEIARLRAELAATRERVRELEDSVQKLVASMERLDWREGVCCCGSPMEHSAWEGHTPVDMGEFHHGSIVDEAKQRLAAPTSAAHTGEGPEPERVRAPVSEWWAPATASLPTTQEERP